MARIAVGGFQHETNTFAPIKATFDAFERADAWPPLRRGEAMLAAVDGVHIPITGGLEHFRRSGHDIVPLCWSSAVPSAHVTEDAYERIVAMLLEDLSAAMPVDGVYLDLHGAMVCQHFEDGEGELLRRVRAIVGDGVPISVSLDLHTNLTDAMIAHADAIDIYRTYPHIDMGETGARAARHLEVMMASGGRWAKAFRRPDFLIPLNFGCTDIEPAKGLYEVDLARALKDGGIPAAALAMGFPLSDIREVGPGLVVYGDDQGTADRAADRFLDALIGEEANFGDRIWQPDEAVAEAMRLAVGASRPVVLADTQDNPGGGGTGDTTGLLRALLNARPDGAVVGLFNDPDSAARAHRAGLGASLTLGIGGRLYPGDSPMRVDGRVEALGDGRFTGTGPMWGGARYEMGDCALIDVDGLKIAIASKAEQTGDQSMFRHLGIEPPEMKVIALKSSVHFRADFAPIAEAVLTVAAPGPVYVDTGGLDFAKIRPGVRQMPRA